MEEESINSLNLQQQDVICNLLDRRKLKDDVRYLAVSGGPGTGKSYLLRSLCKIMRGRHLDYLVLAPTNLAADNVGGKTIHKQIGGGGKLVDLISVMERDPSLRPLWNSNDIEDVTRKVSTYVKNYFGRLGNDKVLQVMEDNVVRCEDLIIVMDECSMVSLPLFYCLLSTLHSPSTTRIVLFGDRFQLTPVSKIKRSLYDLLDEAETNVLRFRLTENMRQRGNEYFKRFILDWWNEKRTGNELKHLKFGGDEDAFRKLPMPKIVLCGRRCDVQGVNSDILKEVEGKPIEIEATVISYEDYADATILQKSSLPPKLYLKNNVPVIMVKTCSEELYTNTICSFCGFNNDEQIALKDSSGKVHLLGKYRDEIKEYDEKTKRMTPIGTVLQFPIALFFSTTTHRVQGITIDFPVLVKYSSFWDEDTRLAYVATSRVTKPELLFYDTDPREIPPTVQTERASQKTVDTVIKRGIKRRLRINKDQKE